MTPQPIRAIIAFAGFTRTIGVRGSKRACDMYVYGVSYGRGSDITKYTYGPDKTKAMSFATANALGIGKQMVARFRNVDVRLLIGDRVERVAPLAPRPVSTDEAALLNDMRQFVSDVKALGPLEVLRRGLVK